MGDLKSVLERILLNYKVGSLGRDEALRTILTTVADMVQNDKVFDIRLSALREVLLMDETDMSHLAIECTEHTKHNIADWLCAQAEEEATPQETLPDVMLRVDGKSYRCECGCNVFREIGMRGSKVLYECNGCGEEHSGVRVQVESKK